MIPIRVANYFLQTVQLWKWTLLVFAEEVDNITMSDKETLEQVKVVGNISNTTENIEQLPDHLQLLYEDVTSYNNCKWSGNCSLFSVVLLIFPTTLTCSSVVAIILMKT